MKSVDELLDAYAQGRRDFPRAQLQGVVLEATELENINLRGSDLSGADLNHADGAVRTRVLVSRVQLAELPGRLQSVQFRPQEFVVSGARRSETPRAAEEGGRRTRDAHADELLRHVKPEDPLQFRKNGQIGKTNASDLGRHTIEVCGLDREQLRGDEAKEYAGMVRIIFTQRTKKSWTWLERQV